MHEGTKHRNRWKTAFILGAGLGTRLRPLTEHCPKPLLDVGGRPAITYAMDHLLGIGIDRFIVNTHHCPDIYLQRFPDRRWRNTPIIFRNEPELLETGGGLKNIEDLLLEDEAILCYNGDVLADLPLEKLLSFHEQKRPEATLALRSNGPFLHVSVNDRNEICDFRNALKNPGTQNCLFTGIYAIETSILQHIEAGKAESIIATFTERIARNPGSIMGVLLDEGNWQDIGSIEIYQKLKNRSDPLENL
jgi:NDP-sugar pyrophosphorylase family protein